MKNSNITVRVSNDKWSADTINCTLAELVEQAGDYTRDRAGMDEDAVTLHIEGSNVVDEDNEIVGEITYPENMHNMWMNIETDSVCPKTEWESDYAEALSKNDLEGWPSDWRDCLRPVKWNLKDESWESL